MNKLFNDYVLIKPIENEKSAGGIVMPSAGSEPVAKGVVMLVGPGKLCDDGISRGCGAFPGDTVLYFQRAVTKVRVGSEDRILAKGESLIGVVE